VRVLIVRDIQRHLDPWSAVVIVITFLMFVVALLLKGLGHDLLLEGGVFLVSVKLIMMAYKDSVAATKLNDRLSGLENTLARIEGLFEARYPSEFREGPPNAALQPTGAHDVRATPKEEAAPAAERQR
jgi:hypothetical protein